VLAAFRRTLIISLMAANLALAFSALFRGSIHKQTYDLDLAVSRLGVGFLHLLILRQIFYT